MSATKNLFILVCTLLCLSFAGVILGSRRYTPRVDEKLQRPYRRTGDWSSDCDWCDTCQQSGWCNDNDCLFCSDPGCPCTGCHSHHHPNPPHGNNDDDDDPNIRCRCNPTLTCGPVTTGNTILTCGNSTLTCGNTNISIPVNVSLTCGNNTATSTSTCTGGTPTPPPGVPLGGACSPSIPSTQCAVGGQCFFTPGATVGLCASCVFNPTPCSNLNPPAALPCCNGNCVVPAGEAFGTCLPGNN